LAVLERRTLRIGQHINPLVNSPAPVGRHISDCRSAALAPRLNIKPKP
jgi:hypothetical protein